MERLSYIDDHAITIDASAAETWSALLRVMCRDATDPSTVPVGFALAEATPPTRLALKGRHPFAVYRWIFELDPEGPQHTRVRSQTWAAFPHLRGKVYRALVIGTGAHRAVVRRTLRRVAAAAIPEADYLDTFEVPIRPGDVRTAEQAFRDGLGGTPGVLGNPVGWVHRHVLRFRLDSHNSANSAIGWTIMRSDHDEFVLAADGPMMHGELTLRRAGGRRAVLITRLHYHHKLTARMVWALVGPLHRAIAPRLIQRGHSDNWNSTIALTDSTASRTAISRSAADGAASTL
ncbi:DUF2867 domain-containing protein [Mycobacterium shimoidei]|uniref:DUF2867 domain-containing protein n=1 Tax=Mycobacterium shimoidei TaxID=29313 RepID=UPI0008488E9E|nr:DUF2867 domain-containing protein [Mycobacterium shimoidei]MCV7257749.1 DUF2867 domain-containing protein [Mycobacterium shimoidei]ODR11970.1 hypothetical protein BHQ16_17920 [Mycobacterium shimoidei]ORW81503.1 hypothetical protein AWC26_07620 [Mycobacterium shimoidei]